MLSEKSSLSDFPTTSNGAENQQKNSLKSYKNMLIWERNM